LDVTMGLLAAVMWGLTDFLVGVNARNAGVRRSVFVGQLLGLVLMSLIVLLSSEEIQKMIDAPPLAWLYGLAAAISTVVGALALAKAFAIGKTSVVAPIITTYGVFTTFLSWLFGEVLSIVQFAGISACVLGVLFISLVKERSPVAKGSLDSSRAILYALAAAICYGASFWLQGKYSLPALGPVNMLLLTYLVGVTCLMNESYPAFKERNRIGTRVYGGLIAASLLNLAGFAAFSVGALSGSLSVVTVISTLSGGIASMLGAVFYREKLKVVQVFGIVVVLLGAILIHMHG